MVLPHLFCCVLPAVLAVIGAASPAAIEIIPHRAEIWLLAFSGIFLAISFYILYFNDCPCGNHGHRWQKLLLWISIIIYAGGLCHFLFGGH